MPDEEPRVRIELVSDRSTTAPELVERSRLPLVSILLMGVTFAVMFVGLARLATPDEPAREDAAEERSANPVTNTDPALDEGTNGALSSALAAQIDAYDQVTYTSISPALTSIVRDGKKWLTIDDFGLIAHSPNLLSWVAVRERRGQFAFALAPHPDGPLALTTTGSDVRVIGVSDGHIKELELVSAVPAMGALAPDGRWAVVLTDSDGQSLLTGAPNSYTQRLSLANERPTSIAITSSHVILTLDDEAGATSLLFAPLSALTGGVVDESVLVKCGAAAIAAHLITTGDAVVHLVEPTRAWVSSHGGDRFELMVDTAGLPDGDAYSVRPIATGVGWSIANTENPAADPMVWITHDGATYEPQRIPSGRGRPGHVIWAYLGGSEGVGVRVSDTAAETGLLRVGDVRARHPRPHELARNVKIDRLDASLDLTSPGCRSSAG